VRRPDHSKAGFFIALVLLGGATSVGVVRDRRGSEVFSKAVFEPAAPTLTVEAREDDVARAPAVLQTGEDLQPIEAADTFDPQALTSATLLALQSGQVLSRELLAGLRGLLQSKSEDAAIADARTEVLNALLEQVDGRVPEHLLSAAPTLLAGLQSRNGPRARRLRPILQQAVEWHALLSRTEVLLQSEAEAERPLTLALSNLRRVLDVDPTHPRARAQLRRLQSIYLLASEQAIAALEFDRAEQLLEKADAVREQASLVADLRTDLFQRKARAESDLLINFELALKAKNIAQATELAARLQRFLPPERAFELDTRIKNAELYGGFQRGERFADTLGPGDASGPDMRVLPIGSFVMGSAKNEVDRLANEGPQRELLVEQGFAMSIGEITVAQFEQFASSQNYQSDAELEGWSLVYSEASGRLEKTKGIHWRNSYRGIKANDRHPVVHVSQRDAKAFAAWLSAQSGFRYRLPTEAEFEYALRGNTTTRFWWGDADPTEVVENLSGQLDFGPEARRWSQFFENYSDGAFGPAPVKSYRPNAFGLMDLAGNVSEWVSDCWHDSYAQAPKSLNAWINQGCELFVVRGGSWGSPPSEARSAARQALAERNRSARVGFRVVREL
jgi:formylglycine-generating enzyme required for sulfatase activity